MGLYPLRLVKMAEHEEIRNLFRILVETPEGDRPPGRPRRRWEGHITVDIKERGCGTDLSDIRHVSFSLTIQCLIDLVFVVDNRAP
jgi:hypothetical protein